MTTTSWKTLLGVPSTGDDGVKPVTSTRYEAIVDALIVLLGMVPDDVVGFALWLGHARALLEDLHGLTDGELDQASIALPLWVQLLASVQARFLRSGVSNA